MTALYLLLAFAVLTLIFLSLVTYGYAGTWMRVGQALRTALRILDAAAMVLIRAIERHAADAHRRHCERWFSEAAE